LALNYFLPVVCGRKSREIQFNLGEQFRLVFTQMQKVEKNFLYGFFVGAPTRNGIASLESFRNVLQKDSDGIQAAGQDFIQ
jgi:hypothetical protein